MSKYKKRISSIVFLVIIVMVLGFSGENDSFQPEKLESIPIIADDPYEPNDNWYDAYPIWDGFQDNLLNQSDDDWYNITVPYGNELVVDIMYDSLVTDMRIELYNSTMDYCNHSESPDDFLNIQWKNWDISQTFYLNVTGWNAQNLYSMNVTLKPFPIPSPNDDGYEENDGWWEASQIWDGFWDNSLNQSDVDCYNITVPYGYELNAILNYDSGSTWMNMMIFNSTLQNHQSSSGGGDTLEIHWQNWDLTQTYYLNISGMNDGEFYEMSVWLIDLMGGPALDDMYEENDNWYDAYPIWDGFYDSNLNQSDNDWYNITVPYGYELAVDIHYDSMVTDMELKLYNSSILFCGSAADLGDDLQLRFQNWDIYQTYYLNVTGWNTQNLYSMNVWLIDLMGGPALDDMYEENDNWYDAHPIWDGFYESNLNQSDDDWYNITVPNGYKLAVDIQYDSLVTDMRIELYNSSMNYCNHTTSPDDFLKLRWENLDITQEFYINVTGWNAQNIYSMNVWYIDLMGGPVLDDMYEENDNWYDAYPIWDGFYDSNLNQSDNDWYNITVPYGYELAVDIHYDSMVTDMELKLYNSSILFCGSAADLGDDLQLRFQNWDIYQTYYLNITGLNAQNIYSMNVWLIDLMGGPVLDDMYEENDFWWDATDIWDGFYESNLNQSDEDWYNITVPYGYELAVDVHFDSMITNMRVDLLDDTLIYCTTGVDSGNDLYIRWENWDSEKIFFLNVSGWNAQNYYEMKVTLKPLPTPSPNDDLYEENDYWYDAYEIWDGFYSDSLNHSDADWFNITVPYGKELVVELRFNHLISYKNVLLYNESMNFCQVSNPMSVGYEVLTWENWGPEQSFYLNVSGLYMQNYYEMTVYTQSLAVPNPNDDIYEDNDYWWQAATVWDGFNENNLNQSDIDCYNITVPYGYELNVMITYDNLTTYMFVQVFNSTLQNYQTASMNSPLEIHYINWDIEQTYYINVSGWNDQGFYEMQVWLVDQNPPSDDPYEDNDDILNPTIVWNGFMDSFMQNDSDWFAVNVSYNYELVVFCYYSDQFTWMKLDLYNNDQSFNKTASDHLTYWELRWVNTNPAMQEVYFHIYGGNDEEFYNLEVYLNYVGPPIEDGYEPNDSWGDATTIGNGFSEDLIQGDDDWYEIAVSPNDEMIVELSYNSGITSMNFEIYNETGHFVAMAWNYGSILNISLISSPTNHYFSIHVIGNNENDTYHLQVDIIGGLPADDWAEPNDDKGDSAYLDQSMHYSGLNMNDEHDWYYLWLNQNDYLNLSIIYDTMVVSFTIELYDDPGILITTAYIYNSTTKVLEYHHTEATSSRYYIHVYGDIDGDIYDLITTVTNIVPLTDDNFEPNDYFWEAPTVFTGYVDGNISNLVQGDDDWYAIEVHPNDEVIVQLYYDDAMTWMHFQIYSDDGMWLVDATDNGGMLNISLVNPTGFNWLYIRVIGDNFSEAYDLHILIPALHPVQPPTDDWAEPNDNQYEYYSLDWGNYTNLIQLDDDWYGLPQVFIGDTVIIWLDYDTFTDDITIELYDNYGTLLLYSLSSFAGRKEITWTSDADYPNLLLIVTGDHQGAPYTINNLLTIDDNYEDNDDMASAVYLSEGFYGNLTCNDDDWFYLDKVSNSIKPGDIFLFDLRYNTDYELMLEFPEDNTNTVYSIEEWGLSIQWTAPEEMGDMHFRIYGDVGVNYELSIEYPDDDTMDDDTTDDDTSDDDTSDDDTSDDDTSDDDTSADDNPFDSLMSSIPGYNTLAILGVFCLSIFSIGQVIKRKLR